MSAARRTLSRRGRRSRRGWPWRGAPRRLRFTREGRVLVGIALAVGFAAVNTGHNLLFLGWGMVLSTIVLSGVLSEASLRYVRLRVAGPEQARAQERCPLALTLTNPSRTLAAFGLEVEVHVQSPDGRHEVAGPHVLRLDPRTSVEATAFFVPLRRGLHAVERVRVQTAFPFGFFEKSRGLRPRSEVRFWVAPPRVDVDEMALSVLGRLGEDAARMAGPGEDFFSLRPMRTGDDPRRVHWRRSAKTGRLVVVETDAESARQVELRLVLAARPQRAAGPHGAEPDDRHEHAIAVFGSLAERLLERGLRIGVRAPGLVIPPEGGERQRWTVLHALARLEAHAPIPEGGLPSGLVVAVVGAGATAPEWVEHVVRVAGPRSRGAAA